MKKKEEDGSTVTNKDDLHDVPVKKDKMRDEGMGATGSAECKCTYCIVTPMKLCGM